MTSKQNHRTAECDLLKSQNNTVTLRVGLLRNVDFAVDHGHNTVAELQKTWLTYLTARLYRISHFLVNDSLILMLYEIESCMISNTTDLDSMSIHEHAFV
jgi:hypothetical protein